MTKKEDIIIKVIPIEHQAYVVVNHEGKYFKNKSRIYRWDAWHNEGTWVDDLSKAKIYTKSGPARSVITWFAKSNQLEAIPYLGVLKMTSCELIDESFRISESSIKDQRAELVRRIKRAESAVDLATRELNNAKKDAEHNMVNANRELAELTRRMLILNTIIKK